MLGVEASQFGSPKPRALAHLCLRLPRTSGPSAVRSQGNPSEVPKVEESNSGNLVKQEGEGLLTKLTLPSLCVSVAHGYRCRRNWSVSHCR